MQSDCSQRSWLDFFMGRPCNDMTGGQVENFGQHPQAQEVILGGSSDVAMSGGSLDVAISAGSSDPALSGGARKSPKKTARKTTRSIRKRSSKKVSPKKASPKKVRSIRKRSPKMVRKSPKKSAPKAEKARGCTVQSQKKQQARKSPPYPANECCNQVKVGNDGLLYKSSKVGAQTACTWKHM